MNVLARMDALKLYVEKNILAIRNIKNEGYKTYPILKIKINRN